MKKKFKHKWWEHLIFKYKVVECERSYHEYERLRHWFTIVAWIGIVIVSPIIAIFYLSQEAKHWFHYEDGKDGRTERYTIYEKEINENE